MSKIEIDEEILAGIVTAAEDVVKAYDNGSGIYWSIGKLQDAIKAFKKSEATE